MKRRRLVLSIAVSFTAAASLLVFQNMLPSAQSRDGRDNDNPPPLYNPYPLVFSPPIWCPR